MWVCPYVCVSFSVSLTFILAKLLRPSPNSHDMRVVSTDLHRGAFTENGALGANMLLLLIFLPFLLLLHTPALRPPPSFLYPLLPLHFSSSSHCSSPCSSTLLFFFLFLPPSPHFILCLPYIPFLLFFLFLFLYSTTFFLLPLVLYFLYWLRLDVTNRIGSLHNLNVNVYNDLRGDRSWLVNLVATNTCCIQPQSPLYDPSTLLRFQ